REGSARGQGPEEQPRRCYRRLGRHLRSELPRAEGVRQRHRQRGGLEGQPHRVQPLADRLRRHVKGGPLPPAPPPVIPSAPSRPPFRLFLRSRQLSGGSARNAWISATRTKRRVEAAETFVSQSVVADGSASCSPW